MTKFSLPLVFFFILVLLTSLSIWFWQHDFFGDARGIILTMIMALVAFLGGRWVESKTAFLFHSQKKLKVQFDSQLGDLLKEKSVQDAIFTSMREGILVVTSSLTIKYLNTSAQKILGISETQSLNQSAQGIIRSAEILNFIKKTAEKKSDWEGELELFDSEVKNLHIHARPLKDTNSGDHDFIFVFSDVSQVKKLENTRRDFVANVSHELRTPLTSIQGFAETLIQHPDLPFDKRKRFLDIIHNHAFRLGMLIDDLLTLSRVERQTETNEVALNLTHLRPVIIAATQMCEGAAKAQGIRIKHECSDSLIANINAPLLEQALVNLIDNAIKYSEPNKEVFVAGTRENGFIKISVTDQGIGIPPEQLDRIFERFYRIDKARSKKVGGTGLGLAIVKHIAMAHGAQIQVQSKVNQSSSFSILLPVVA
ncbi:MAG: ATP-binding protein [Pseudomonadota bacterium]|nr:ATP-binding protein [Pseudomonadota bacterium]